MDDVTCNFVKKHKFLEALFDFTLDFPLRCKLDVKSMEIGDAVSTANYTAMETQWKIDGNLLQC